MRHAIRFAPLLPAALLACTGAPPAQRADASVATDAPPAPMVEDVRVPGVRAPVEVTLDDYGWPHIVARTLDDAARAQGYLQARQRFLEMDLFRRNCSGTLAEIVGALSPTVIEGDIASRVVGYRRTAQRVWDTLPDGDSRRLLIAFAEGVNAHIAELRSGRASLPRGSDFLPAESIPDWTPVDTLTIVRLQTAVQSYSTGDIARSELVARATERFDRADPMSAPERFARRGYARDLLRVRPATTATTIPPEPGRGGGGPPGRPRPRDLAPTLPIALFDDLRGFQRGIESSLAMLGWGDDRGSNNWVVAGSATRSRHALLASDPHVTLPSPALFWGCHLTVTTEPAIDAIGTIIPGVPGILMGATRRVAWGMTNSNYDVADVYVETIVPGTGGAPDGVRFNGAVVPLELLRERIPTGSAQPLEITLERVPHHGVLLPTIRNGRIVARTGTTAMAVRWTGNDPSNEIEAILGILRASNVAEARRALRAWGGPPLSFVFADVEGNVAFSSQATVPVRAPGARSFDPMSNPGGTTPCVVLPGDGTAEWTATVEEALLPNAVNTPERPFLATANNDLNGALLDDNPVNDRVYLTCSHDPGFRQQRILTRLGEVSGRATADDMEAIQGDHRIEYAARIRPFLAQAMTRLAEERARAGAHPDLSAVAMATSARAARLDDAARRIARWSLESPAGVEHEASEAQRTDAVATTLFHAFVFALQDLLYADEVMALEGVGRGSLATTLFLLEHPEQSATLDRATMQSALWDDLTTPTRETRDAVLVRALDRALQDFEPRAGNPDLDTWLWGRFHTLRFNSLVPGPGAALSIPPAGDMTHPRGFPRHGGFFVVDSSSPQNASNYAYSHGPGHRLVVEMDPAGPRVRIALPGGQEMDLASPHRRDEAELWRVNRSHAVPRGPAEVAAVARRRLRLMP